MADVANISPGIHSMDGQMDAGADGQRRLPPTAGLAWAVSA